jgi:hypothetical protein
MNTPPPHALAGGWVRVEACNSTWINERHPRESTRALSRRTRGLLRGMGHSGRQWGAADAARAGSRGGGGGGGKRAAAAARREGGAGFQRYTVHATELRLLLHAARSRGEKFHITYTLLPPVVDEVGWHAPPGGGSRTATLTPAGSGGGYECVEWTDVGVHGGGGGGGDSGESGGESGGGSGDGSSSTRMPAPKPCGDALLLAMMSPPGPHWALRVHAAHSYPVLDNEDADSVEDLSAEVHCVGS